MKRYHTYLAENQHFEMGLEEVQTVLVKYKIGDGGFGEGRFIAEEFRAYRL